MKRMRLNIVLAAVLLALGVAVYFAQKPNPEAAKPPLTALNSATITHVAVTVPAHPVITLDKGKDGHWMLTAPVKAPADPYEVNGLPDVATSSCEQKIPPSDVKLADFGLQPPRYQLTFDKDTIDVGESEPIRYRRYAKFGDTVCLISNPVSQSVSGNYSSLVNKQLLPAAAQIERLEVPGMTLVRKTDGGWDVTPADASKGAADDAAQKLVDAWAAASASFMKMAPSKGAGDSDEKVTVSLKDGTTIHYVIVKHQPQLELERDDYGVIYNLPKTANDSLLKLQPAPPKKAAAAASSKAPLALPKAK